MLIFLLFFFKIWQVPGVSDLGLTPRRINKVAVIGGGLMGSGIATALILSNYPVILKEVNENFLEAGLGRVKGKPGIYYCWLYSCYILSGLCLTCHCKHVSQSTKPSPQGDNDSRKIWKNHFPTQGCPWLWKFQRCGYGDWGKSHILLHPQKVAIVHVNLVCL